jgi:hypothetical protein
LGTTWSWSSGDHGEVQSESECRRYQKDTRGCGRKGNSKVRCLSLVLASGQLLGNDRLTFVGETVYQWNSSPCLAYNLRRRTRCFRLRRFLNTLHEVLVSPLSPPLHPLEALHSTEYAEIIVIDIETYQSCAAWLFYVEL